MLGFLAVVLNMGIIQLGNLKDYWRTDDTTDLPFFRSVFSRDRFFQIFGALYVGDPTVTTKQAKIQPLLDKLCTSFSSSYTPHQQISIDESVISFKGRVAFKQYLNCKPNPWGIKAYVLADSVTGYLRQLCIYYGPETVLGDFPSLGQTGRVVCTLAEPFSNSGYDLYIDRFYSSPSVATQLTSMGITVTGTVQSNRKGLPEGIQKKTGKGTVEAFRSDDGNGDQLFLTWMDKRMILMLSTKHSNGMENISTRYKLHN